MSMTFEELHGYVEKEQPNICGITALKDGEEVYSDCWHGYNASDTVHIMSVTKSVVSLLVGIALDKGLIGSVSQPVPDFFPDYTPKRGEKTIQSVTVKHLLTMTAPYKYRSEPWTRICSSPDWTRETLDILGGRGGITGEFKYSTLGVHLLTSIIAARSGMATVDFANEYLFGPLGIAPRKAFVAKNAGEHKAFIMGKEPKGDVWFTDPQGVGTAGYGLCLSAKDMARIGQLCLDGGSFGGKRIVSEEWIEESTHPYIRSGDKFDSMYYGYLWWTPTKSRTVYAALGNSGNVIYIDTKHKTVVAVSAYFKPSVLDRVKFIQKYIIPLTGG